MKKLWQKFGVLAFWVSWPGLWLYLRGSKRTRVIMVSGDQVLLLKGWLGAGQWILPGGGAHRGENPIKAAVREVKEETAIQLDPVLLKTLDTMEVCEYGLRYQCTVYVVDLPTPLETTAQKWEITDIAWVDKKDLENLSPLTHKLLTDWL